MRSRRVVAAIIVFAAAAAVLRGQPRVPRLEAVDQDGRTVDFYRDVVGSRTVAINFIFTSCTGICPRLAANFAAVQRELRTAGLRDVALVSVSVDPANDTPAKLKAWRAAHGGRAGWTLLTGSRSQIDALLAQLGAAAPDPASHPASVVIGSRDRWSRIDGLAPPAEVVGWIRSAQRGERPASAGERIFTRGSATRVAETAACANCHGRDGRGGTDGGVTAPAIRWSDLTKPYGAERPAGRRTAAYDVAALRRALESGVDASGRPLDRSMPRYAMTTVELDALAAYLRTLDSHGDPGVDDGTVRVGLWGAEAAACAAIDDATVHRRRVEWITMPPRLASADASTLALVVAAGNARNAAALEAWSERTGMPALITILGEPPVRRRGSSTVYRNSGDRERHAEAIVDALATIVKAPPARVALVSGDASWSSAAVAAAKRAEAWGWRLQPRRAVPSEAGYHVVLLGPHADIMTAVATGSRSSRFYIAGAPDRRLLTALDAPIRNRISFSLQSRTPACAEALKVLDETGREATRRRILAALGPLLSSEPQILLIEGGKDTPSLEIPARLRVMLRPLP